MYTKATVLDSRKYTLMHFKVKMIYVEILNFLFISQWAILHTPLEALLMYSMPSQHHAQVYTVTLSSRANLHKILGSNQ